MSISQKPVIEREGLASGLYLFFSLAAICLTDVVAVHAPGVLPYWELAIHLSLVAMLLVLIVSRARRGQFIPFYAWLCIAYFLLVGIVGSQHALALHALPASAPVDATGLPAMQALKSEVMFTVFLQLFPLMLMAQYFLLKRMSLLGAVRILNAMMAISVLVLFYQAFGDYTFLCVRCDPGRFAGLATDLSAYPLLVPIAFGFALAGIKLERRMPAKLAHLGLAAMLVATIALAGSRDLLGGTLIYACIFPLVLAGIRQDMPFRRRLVLAATPAVVVIAVAGVLASGLTHDAWVQHSRVIHKLDKTAYWVEKDGLSGALFQGNLRGWLFDDAVTMIAQAPFSGWGPGAFYRDLANVSFLKGRIISRRLASPHDHYLHMAVDLGIPGLLGNLLLILLPMGLGIRIMRRTQDMQTRYVAAVLWTAGVVFLAMLTLLPFSWFLDVSWAFGALLAALMVLAERQGLRAGPATARLRVACGVVAVLVLVAMAYGSHRQAFGPAGYAARQRLSWWDRPYERNCYPAFGKARSDGRWCGRNAKLLIRVRGRHPHAVSGSLRVMAPDVGKKHVTVRYGIAGGEMRVIDIADHAWHPVRLALSADEIKVLPHRRGRYVFLHLDASRTWSAARDGSGRDRREFGVAYK